MPSAYVLVNVRPDHGEIIAKIKKILVTSDSLVGYEVHGVYGIYDVIIKAECGIMRDLGDLVAKIRRMDQVISTITMIINEA